MRELEDRYISLLTDFGFKRIFGTAPNKELLICFLNSLFDGTQVIRDVKYLNNEHLGDSSLDRTASCIGSRPPAAPAPPGRACTARQCCPHAGDFPSK